MGLGDSQVALDILLNAVDNTKAGADSTIGRLGKIGDALGFVAKVGGVTAGAMIALGGVAVKVFTNSADAARDMSEKFGMAANVASSWLAAGKAVNVSNSTITTGFQMLTRTMGNLDMQFITTGKFTAAQNTVFKELGVQIMDAHGKMRPLNDVMLDIATRFKGMPDGAEKAALAMKLFGRSGTDMIPFLNQGASGIKDLMEQAKRYGAVVGQEDVEASKGFHLELGRIKLQAEGVWITLARGLMPVLSTVFGVISGVGMPALLRFSQWFATEGAPRLQDFALKTAQVGERELPKLFNGAKSVLSQLQPMVEPLKQIAGQLLGLLPSVASASGLFGAWSSASSAMPSLLNLVVAGLKIAAPLIKLLADNVNTLIPVIYAMIAVQTAWKVVSFANDLRIMALAYRSLAAEEGFLAAVNALLGISFGPITIAILAISVVAALVAVAWSKNWGDIQGKTQTAIAIIGGVVGGMVAFFKAVVPAVVGALTSLWTGITTILGNIASWLGTWGPFILVLLTGPIGLAVLFVIQHFGKIRDTVAAILGVTIKIVAGIWGGITGALAGPVQVVAGILSGLWKGIADTATAAWNALMGVAKTIFGAIASAISGIMSNIHIPLPHFTFSSHKDKVAGVELQVPGFDVKWYGQGGDFIANRPMLIGVGDGGAERVTVRPLGAGGGGLGGDINITIGSVDSPERIRQLTEAIGREIEKRRLAIGGRSLYAPV